MTTQLIRSTMRFMSDAGIDPTELQWFDSTGMFQDKTHVDSDPLLECRPPFEKCMVVFQGKTTSGRPMEMFMTVAGDDPEDGIAISVWRAPAGGKPVASPLLVYAIDGGLVRYGAAERKRKHRRERSSDDSWLCLRLVQVHLAKGAELSACCA